MVKFTDFKNDETYKISITEGIELLSNCASVSEKTGILLVSQLHADLS